MAQRSSAYRHGTTQSRELPLISVILPVYNSTATLPRVMDVVLAQTYHNLEILLVDDGSTDGSGELCDQFARQDSRVHVIHQINQGLSGARNSALEIAHGDFITFVDADDIVAPTLIDSLHALITTYHTKMSVCAFQTLHGLVLSPSTTSSDEVKVLNTVQCLTAMLLEQGFSFSAWGKLYSRELFAQVRFPSGKLYEDVGTTYKILLQCPKIAVSNARLYGYYQSPTSITHQPFSPAKLALLELTDQMCDDLERGIIAHPPVNTQPAELERLIDAVRLRRLHARFSILRQMVARPRLPSDFKQTEQEIIQYIRTHQSDILHNPLATRRYRFALYALNLSPAFFAFAWRFYAKFKN